MKNGFLSSMILDEYGYKQAATMSAIDFNTTQLSISRLLADKRSGKMKVAEHQRNATVWKDEQRAKLVDSVKKRMPFPSILIYEDEDQIFWLEDGLQRITTLEKFAADEFVDMDGHKFSVWTETDKQRLMDYRCPVLIYTGANEVERVEIFDRFQNGSPLKVGERLHSLSYTPLVKFTRKMFYEHVGEDGVSVPGLFSERASRVWGQLKIGAADKRYDELLKLVALVNGAAHGFEGAGCGISKKWIDLRTNLFKVIDEGATVLVLDQLFSIYEEASAVGNDGGMKRADAKKIQSAQRDIGNFSGPIIYSLITYNTEWVTLRKGWLEALADYREDASYLKNEIHKGLSSARSWNKKRWQNAYNNVFGIDEESVSQEDEDDEEEEDY
jgi:hypothetical protein